MMKKLILITSLILGFTKLSQANGIEADEIQEIKEVIQGLQILRQDFDQCGKHLQRCILLLNEMKAYVFPSHHTRLKDNKALEGYIQFASCEIDKLPARVSKDWTFVEGLWCIQSSVLPRSHPNYIQPFVMPFVHSSSFGLDDIIYKDKTGSQALLDNALDCIRLNISRLYAQKFIVQSFLYTNLSQLALKGQLYIDPKAQEVCTEMQERTEANALTKAESTREERKKTHVPILKNCSGAVSKYTDSKVPLKKRGLNVAYLKLLQEEESLEIESGAHALQLYKYPNE